MSAMADLLFLCHRIPYPPNKGDKIRAYHWLDHLADRFRVHLGCFVDDPADLAHVPMLERRVARLAAIPLSPGRARLGAVRRVRPGRPLSIGYYDDRRMWRFVEETASRWRPETVVAFSAAMAPYAAAVDGAKRLLDMVDVDSEKFAAYAEDSTGAARLFWAREARTLLRFERRAAACFDRTLFVSAAEESRFLALAPAARGATAWVPNGVDAGHFAPDHGLKRPFPPGATAVFTGAMDYRPNVDACVWFAEQVLPRLQATGAAPRFCIVGANPAPAIRRLAARAGILVTGAVADTRPYLAHADVAVAPLAIARGVQNKVLEAMAMAKPVVATAAAFTGIEAEPGRDLLIADDPAAMAEAVASVLAGRHPGLGPAARAAVTRNHAWQSSYDRFDSVLEAASRPPELRRVAPAPVTAAAGGAHP